MTLAELKLLYIKQKLVKAKFTEIERFIEDPGGIADFNQIKNRLDEMPHIKSEYENLFIQIINMESEGDDIESRTDIAEMTTFVSQWHNALSNLQKLAISRTPGNNPVASNQSECNNGTAPNVRLPVINLPEFSGLYKDWLPFYDSFKSLIHENSSLSDCQKFHYLKSCLKGEASRSIESLTTSNSNYATAWELLQKRYRNNRLIVQSHVQAILNTPEIGKATSDNLRKLIDDITTNVESLRVLKVPVDSCDVFINALIQNKLDYNTRREFENKLDTTLPTRAELIEFLEKKCTVLESMKQDSNNGKFKQTPFNTGQPRKVQPTIHKAAYSATNNSVPAKLSCHYCKQRHVITKCNEFLALSVEQRRKQIEKRNLCVNCFRDNHKTPDCKATTCKVCNTSGHHTLLHRDKAPSVTITQPQPVIPNAELSSTSSNSCIQNTEPDVILSTAIILIEDSTGNLHRCRCLLDVGSQLNLLSKSLSEKLNTVKLNTNMSIWGVNASYSQTSQMTDVIIHSLHTPYKKGIRCHVIEKVTTNIPVNSFVKTKIQIPQQFNLADSQFNVSQPIDLIVGAEVFWEILCSDRIKLHNQNLYLSETLLGWIIGGAIDTAKTAAYSCSVVRNRRDDSDLDNTLQQFWMQEEISNAPEATRTAEEQECEDQFRNTVKRDSIDGRFIVQLPFKGGKVDLGDSSKIAIKRFISLERRFRQDELFKKAYVESFQENLNLGIIERVPVEDLNSEAVFFLPHSGVFKKSATLQKIRIVFDGSAKSSNGLSLNDNLMTGPNLQNDLFDILIRFRKHQIVISCDMEKMFLQIKVGKAQQNYQRLFWRESEEKPLEQYRLTRLVFGLTNSPYTAMRCVRQLAEEAAKEFPEVSRVLQRDIFMDDILCGADNVESAINLRDDLKLVLGGASFKLNKWASNEIETLFPAHTGQQPPVVLNFDNTDTMKILGLWWNPTTDTLCYKVQKPIIPEILTKRLILSSIAKIYDPIGLIAPVVIKAKIFMQNLWSLDLNWDDPVSDKLKSIWSKFVEEMSDLNNFHVQRKIVTKSGTQNDLIAFCDASLQAYGASIYLRCVTPTGKVDVNLICSKTRVSPIKVVSLPRLELCAAVLATKLMTKVSKALEIQISNKYYFTDSMIALHYIQSNANKWQVYVANRVAQIQRNSNIQDWYHVASEQNPADIISRGAYAREFINSDLYWHGPTFLKLKNSIEPTTAVSLPPDSCELLEKRKVILTVSAIRDLPVLTKISSFVKLQRVIAYVLRFIHNAKNNANHLTGHLTSNEMRQTRIVIFKVVQSQEFSEDISNLQNNRALNKNSKLRNLDPFLDSDGLLRVGGRLAEADIPYRQKHPIILPPNHHVTRILIDLEHISLFHAGPSQIIASLKTKYWILRVRNVVKKVLRCCIRCFRAAPKLTEQKMGNLPKVRLEPCRPFLNVGLDYLGPLTIREGGSRSKRRLKVWVALFVCLVTRAVHLEIVSNLTSESFIACLKRFIGRRGKVAQIYCDNATTFVGAKRELKQILNFLKNQEANSDFYNFLAIENIVWHFIPPRAPNFGGLWERLVKSVKFHFVRVVGSSLLSFEELNTFIIQVEAIINSRPLNPMSNDLTDYETLTPSHFIIGEAMTELSEYDFRHTTENRLNHWQKIQKLKQDFWQRFSKEVLTQLQKRSQWYQANVHPPAPGTMVLIGDDSPPLAWKLGRIEELITGQDGLPRVATVRTSRGIYKRSIRQLAVLPLEEDK